MLSASARSKIGQKNLSSRYRPRVWPLISVPLKPCCRTRRSNRVISLAFSSKYPVGFLLLQVGNAALDQNTYTIRQTALEYLPQTLQRYLSLPPAYRNAYPLQDGKTATQLLVEQLTLLDQTMKKIVANFLADDSQALLANGRFLADRFQNQDFLKAV